MPDQPQRIRIVCTDGTPGSVSVTLEDGTPLDYVTRVTWSCAHNEMATAILEIDAVLVDVVGNLLAPKEADVA